MINAGEFALSVLEGVLNILWEGLIPLIIIFVTIEIIAVILAYPERLLSDVENQEAVKERASELQGRALTLAGLAFAGFSLLLTVEEGIGSLLKVFQLLALAVGLLFISYQAKEYTRSKEHWRIVQEKTLSYGFLTVFLASTLTFSVASDAFPWILSGALLVAGIIRFNTVNDQIRMYIKMRRKETTGEKGRLSFLIDRLKSSLTS